MDVKLRKASLNEVIRLFLTWDNDAEATEVYNMLIEEVDEPAGKVAEMCFWAGLWYAKTHPEEVEIIIEPPNTRNTPKRLVNPAPQIIV